MSKALAVLQELKECASYWSEYDVPIGIHERIDEAIAELLAQPEQTPDYYLWFDEVHEEHPTNEGDDDVMELYLAPPKREPLSDGTTADMWHANKKATHADSYWAGVSDAEKAHGIGE